MSNALRAIAVALLLITSLRGSAQLRVPDAQQFVGQPQGSPMSGASLDRKAQEVAGHLRCPVCQGLSIGDSPSAMAINMRAQVRELLARGYTDEQIDHYFEQSYGQFVLLKPRFQGPGIMVWLLPLLVLLAGLLIVYVKVNRLAAPAAPASERPTDDRYRDRVRELVGKG